MIQVDLIQMDDYPADSCAINPMAFLLQLVVNQFYYQLFVESSTSRATSNK